MASEENKFNLKIVHDKFLNALHDEDDVKLQHYIESYNELYKFFQLMGTVFGFVSKDLRSKMDILNEFLHSNDGNNYETVKKMIEYEKTNELLNKKNYVSASRTLLRLHRGLDFIREFLRSVGELNDSDNTAQACREAYDQTLAKHHPFMIRKGAKLAMFALPNREQLLKRACGDSPEEIQHAASFLPKTLEVTAVVFERVETLYTVHDLHSLP